MSERALQPIPVITGPAALDLLPALTAALSGAGPALAPQLPGHAQLHLPGTLAGADDDPDDPTVAVVATSGSTRRPRGVLLQASALLASVSATHDRLGGPGRWLLALPVHHVAGLQVLVRSLVSRTRPVAMDLSPGFEPGAFAAAAQALDGAGRRYTALVPTQLLRLLEAGGPALDALAGMDAVLIGGAAVAPTLLERARGAGVRVVTTYGMSETCGGCIYDGRPLDGVEAAVDGDGRLYLGGPTVARGYLDAASTAFSTGPDGVRWFRTDDAGRWETDQPGLLQVLGRLDDAVITGGVTVSPRAVEDALLELSGVAEAVVIGVPDPRWGQQVVAALVLRPTAVAPSLEQVVAHVSHRVEPAAAPRRLLVLDELPLRGPGKPDRAAIVKLAAR